MFLESRSSEVKIILSTTETTHYVKDASSVVKHANIACNYITLFPDLIRI